MKKLNSRETIILAITLILAVVFVLLQFVVKPMRQGALDIDERLQSDHLQLIKASKLVAQQPMVESRYKNLADLIGVVDSEEALMPMIVSKIESAARESNIHVSNIQPMKSFTQKEAMFLAVEVEIDGQWSDIAQFLALVQQPPNFYFINELNLEKYSGAMNTLRGRIVISRMCLINPSQGLSS